MQLPDTNSRKQHEFRRYLAGSGIADALISFFRYIRGAGHAPSDGLGELTKFFGEYRHPTFDVAAELEMEKLELQKRLEVGGNKAGELRAVIRGLERSVIAKDYIKKLDNKAGDIPREFMIKCMLGPVAAKKCNSQLLALIPKVIDGGKLRRYVESSEDVCAFVQPWTNATPESPAWENVVPSEEMSAFWKGYIDFVV